MIESIDSKAAGPAAAAAPDMTGRIDAFAWEATPLGPRTDWPISLKTLVNLMLASAQPMFIAWGPQRTWLYNDAFAPIMGDKHPAMLGRPALEEVWSEARAELTPLFDQVFAGRPVQMDDVGLGLDRRGLVEEAHFAFSYTPAPGDDGGIEGLFGVCTETTEHVVGRRRQAETENALTSAAVAARAAAERVDLALRAGAIVGTWVWDVVKNDFIADKVFARSFGIDPQACEAGLPLERVMESIHPDDVDRVGAAVAEALERGGAYRCEYRVLPTDGEYRWIEASGRVEMDADGRPVRFPGVLIDMHDRRRTEEALRQANGLLRTLMEAVPGVVYAKDREGRLLVGNRGTAELLGRAYEDFVGRTDMEMLDDPAQAAAIMANDRRIMDSRIPERLEEQVTFPDGTEAWWHSTKAPLFDDAGEVVGLIGSSVDITDRRRAEEHRQLLLNELNHRVKNTLAVVQAIARQTYRHAEDHLQAYTSFESRLAALSKAHNLLTSSNWEAADLADIVADQVGEVGARARVCGPKALLSPQLAVSVALALHELATNAAKYGALSNETGVVHVAWSVDGDRILRLRWEEAGGPAVSPPRRQGFGSRMIERALAAELGGEVRIQYLPAGVVCELTAPLA